MGQGKARAVQAAAGARHGKQGGSKAGKAKV